MKHAVLLIPLFLFTAVVHAGLTASMDPLSEENTSVSSYSGFTGDVPPGSDVPGGSGGDYEIPANAILWADFDPQAYEVIDLIMPGEYYFSGIPSELAGLIVKLMGGDPFVVPVEPASIPEPTSCLLLGAGFLMLRRRR